MQIGPSNQNPYNDIGSSLLWYGSYGWTKEQPASDDLENMDHFLNSRGWDPDDFEAVAWRVSLPFYFTTYQFNSACSYH